MRHIGPTERSPAYVTGDYGVPDDTVSDLPAITINSVRVKRRPIFGRVISIHWVGNDYGLRIIGRLNARTFPQLINNNEDITIRIRSYPDYGCWILPPSVVVDVPFKGYWDVYQEIAQQLLPIQPR